MSEEPQTSAISHRLTLLATNVLSLLNADSKPTTERPHCNMNSDPWVCVRTTSRSLEVTFSGSGKDVGSSSAADSTSAGGNQRSEAGVVV